MSTNNPDQKDISKEPGSNSDKQDTDKAPGEERGKYEQVTSDDLKGKKVDADPSAEDGKPVSE